MLITESNNGMHLLNKLRWTTWYSLDVGTAGYETASFFFDRSREALCEIGSEMDVRTMGTVNSRLAETLLLRAPRQ